MNLGTDEPGQARAEPLRPGLIAGLMPTSLVDFPGRIAATLFLSGCNFRCPFCHNPELVVGPADEVLKLDDLGEWLGKRKRLIEGVCITGGEPCVSLPALTKICQELRAQGLAVKLDSNGSLPEAIDKLLAQSLVHFVSLDIKTAPEDYPRATGVNADPDAVERSVRLVREAGVPHELRTTIVPRLHSVETIRRLGQWVGGESTYCLQAFRPEKTLDPEWTSEPPPTQELLAEMAAVAGEYFPEVIVRA
ncbi:MAG: anaerobic ribonucleoside-triphosphate reductase activating protein [Armatimonadetes bacterium]|nr:anaerobic ribonucleoside-triphosphate reductase activating protein [Armatimonadota bacterium]